jgi:hypothetical protein
MVGKRGRESEKESGKKKRRDETGTRGGKTRKEGRLRIPDIKTG